MNKNKLLFVLLLMFPLYGLCSDPEPVTGSNTEETPFTEDELDLFDEDDIIEVFDPFEPVNRAIFFINDRIYFLVAKPLARGWRAITPEGLRTSVKNFFTNLQAPVRIINATLQGKFAGAGTEIIRFGTNSTLGLFGLFDPAKDHFGQLPVDEDTGQTLGFYGVGPGPFIVLPFLGPSNLRDAVGLYADTQMDLARHIWDENKVYIRVRVADAINELSLDKDTYETIKRDALDPYLYMRDAHAQFRRNQIAE
jgi:phospholipid-binding lipoprotein MlaA